MKIDIIKINCDNLRLLKVPIPILFLRFLITRQFREKELSSI